MQHTDREKYFTFTSDRLVGKIAHYKLGNNVKSMVKATRESRLYHVNH